MKVLLVDNYDSFTHNLYHYLVNCGALVDVVRSRELDVSTIHHYNKLVFSPGPGLPEENPVMFDVLREADGKIPILGVCLGMQALAVFFGGTLKNQEEVKHGVRMGIELVSPAALFEGIPNRFNVGLYHSWVVDELPEVLRATAFSDEGRLMAIEHTSLPYVGVQFHPESILTEQGDVIVQNFLNKY